MKKIIFCLSFVFLFVALYAQDIVLPESFKEFYRKDAIALYYKTKSYRNPNLLDSALKAYEELFKMNVPEKKYCGSYTLYADLLAKTGNFEKAIHYYDLAFNLKVMEAKEFAYSYRAGYFEKAPLLYNNKKKEYEEKSRIDTIRYTLRELQRKVDIQEIYTADQFARLYATDHPQHSKCSKNIILYADSITMVKILALLEKYPEYDGPFPLGEVSTVVSRHIFTAYPQFWLTHFEPRYRKSLIEGNFDPQTYAIMYDRCIITAKGEKSYYGEWDNNGLDANPNKDLVNKRRFNLGLPPLEEKVVNPYIVYPVHTH